MSLRTEIEANYIDAYGLVNPLPCLKTDFDKTGNGLLYTSLYYLQLERNDDIWSTDQLAYETMIKQCTVKEKSGYPIRGLFNRSETKRETQSADDYYGVCAASLDEHKKELSSVLQYGIQNNWVFNNETPGRFTWKAWFGRMPWFVAHVYFCAGMKPNIFLRAALCARLALGSLGTSPSGRILDWLMVISCRDSWMCRQAVRIWTWGLYERYPRGMKQVIEECFGVSYPLAKHWVD